MNWLEVRMDYFVAASKADKRYENFIKAQSHALGESEETETVDPLLACT